MTGSSGHLTRFNEEVLVLILGTVESEDPLSQQRVLLSVAFALLGVADDAQAAWWICLPPAQQSTETSDVGAAPSWARGAN